MRTQNSEVNTARLQAAGLHVKSRGWRRLADDTPWYARTDEPTPARVGGVSFDTPYHHPSLPATLAHRHSHAQIPVASPPPRSGIPQFRNPSPPNPLRRFQPRASPHPCAKSCPAPVQVETPRIPTPKPDPTPSTRNLGGGGSATAFPSLHPTGTGATGNSHHSWRGGENRHPATRSAGIGQRTTAARHVSPTGTDSRAATDGRPCPQGGGNPAHTADGAPRHGLPTRAPKPRPTVHPQRRPSPTKANAVNTHRWAYFTRSARSQIC